MNKTAAAALLFAAAAACRSRGPQEAAPDASAPAAELKSPLTQAESPTDDPEIATGNLDSQLRGFEKALEQLPDVPMLQKIASMHLVRGQFYSSVSDYERAMELGERAVKEHGKEANAWLLRAKVRAALHLFEGARADVAEARKRGAFEPSADDIEATIDQSVGKLEDALRLMDKPRKLKMEDVYSLGQRAAITAEQGDLSSAEHMFANAQALHRDTSPFPLAWLYFHQGLAWQRAGYADRARVLYQAAVDRLPKYAPAVSHLAALLPKEKAIPLLEPLAKGSEDPEYEGQLAGLVEDEAMRARAAKRYEALLAKHPEAYASHAAKFFLGVGRDPKKALSAAEKDLEQRRTDEAYEIALKAAIAAHDGPAACRIADRVKADPSASKPTLLLTQLAYESCKK